MNAHDHTPSRGAGATSQSSSADNRIEKLRCQRVQCMSELATLANTAVALADQVQVLQAEKEYSLDQIKALRAKNRELEVAHEQQLKRMVELADKAGASASLVTINETLRQKQGDLAKRLHAEKEAKMKEVEVLNGRIAEWETRYNELSTSHDQVKDRLAAKEQELASVKGELRTATANYSKLRQQFEARVPDSGGQQHATAAAELAYFKAKWQSAETAFAAEHARYRELAERIKAAKRKRGAPE